MRRGIGILGLLVTATAGCGSSEPARRPDALELTFSPAILDTEEEAYECFAFDAEPLRGALIRTVEWTTPAGGVSLHHAKLSVTSEPMPTGDSPFPCDPMPADLLGLDLWVPGGSGLALPDDVALEVPEAARSIVIEAHALREETPPESGAMVRIGLANAVPPHVATWAKVEAPVPAIRPLMTERSTATCLFSEDFHVISALPHMHRVGAEFHGTRIQGSTREPFLDVVPWNFDEQQSYPLALDVTAGDRVEAECIWQNPTDAYVLPGMYTKNEMCTLGLLGYPSGAGDCTQE